MRILHAGDLHCFYDNYGAVGPDGEHSRLKDWKRTAEALVRVAIEREAELAVFPGDLWKNSRPSPAAIIAVADLFRALDGYGIQVVACEGNHDAPGIGQMGPVDELSKLTGRPEWGVTVPRVVSARYIDVAVLPFAKPAALIDQTGDPAALAALVSTKLVEIARGLAAKCTTRPRILIGHWTIQGSISSSGQVMGVGTEPAIPLSELTGLGFDAVLMGHIHKPQVLSEHPYVAYAGSLERCDFGEENDPRGCYIIDTETGAYEWVDLPARRFLTCELYRAEVPRLLDNPTEIAAYTGIPGAIVRIKLPVTEEQAKRVDAATMVKALQDAGAHYVAGVQLDIERADRTRESTITEQTGPAEALERWLALKADLTPERRQAVAALAQSMMTEVA